jgi:hypothetical protein
MQEVAIATSNFLALPFLKVLQVAPRASRKGFSHDLKLLHANPAKSVVRNIGNLAALSVLTWPAPIRGLPELLKEVHVTQRLDLDINYLPDLREVFPIFRSSLNLDTLDRGLRHLCNTLVHLVLQYNIIDDDEGITEIYCSDTLEGNLIFLKTFTALVTLELSPNLLAGQAVNEALEMFPRNLTLSDLTTSLPPHLRSLESPTESVLVYGPRS